MKINVLKMLKAENWGDNTDRFYFFNMSWMENINRIWQVAKRSVGVLKFYLQHVLCTVLCNKRSNDILTRHFLFPPNLDFTPNNLRLNK